MDNVTQYDLQFSRVQLLATPWTAAHQASLSITNSQNLLKLMSIKSVMPSNHLTFCHTLLLLPSIFPSTRIFSNESVLRIRWPEYWCFRFSISPSNEHPGLISFRMDWLDLLAVQGTLKSLLQHHSSTASFFGTQVSLWFNSHIHTWLLEKPYNLRKCIFSVFFRISGVCLDFFFFNHAGYTVSLLLSRTKRRMIING